MQQGGERAPLNPIVAWVIIGVVVVAALAVGFKVLGAGGGKFDNKGSEVMMEKVKAGGKLYEPPAAALPPAARGMMGGGPAGATPYNIPNGPPTGPTAPTGAPTGGQ